MDDAACKILRDNITLTIDLEQYREHEPVLLRAQRTDIGRELDRQHGNRAIGKIDAGAALAGFRIQRAARWHEERHVSDVHAHPEGPPRQCLD